MRLKRKKGRKAYAWSLLLALALPLAFGSMPCGTAYAEGEASGAAGQFGKPSDGNYAMKVAENDGFELMANADGTIAVLDKRSGHLYESNPREEDPLAAGINMTNLRSQLYVTYADTAGNVSVKNSTTECVNKDWLTFTGTGDGGIRFLYDFQAAGFEIPVEYHLNDKGLVAEIVVEDIVEGKGDSLFHLTDIAFLPFFGAAGTESEGYILVPDGSGALIYLNNDKASYGAYSQTVYGRDLSLITEKLSADSETARLPVFGMKDGSRGFLAILSRGETNAAVNAMTSGTLNSYNNVYASFRYRPFTRTTFLQGNTYASNGQGGDTVISLTISPVTPKTERYRVEYILLSEEELDYVDMADAYKDYLKERYGISPEANRTEAPFYVNLLGGLRKEEYILGVKARIMEPLTTYAQAEEILGALEEAGIGDMAVKYTGWQKGGMESRVPSGVSYEGKLGGKSGFASLAEYAGQKGIELFLDLDFVNLYEGGGGISEYNDAAQTVGSTPAYQYTYDYNSMGKNNRDRWKILAPAKIFQVAQDLLEEKDKFYGAQPALSTLGSGLYSDFTHKENGIDRADALGVWENVFAAYRDAFDYICVDNGNAYTFPYATHIYDAPTGSSEYDIEDETVPFYQIVLHGMVSCSTEPLNLSADPERLVLKAAETGSSLSACLMYADNEVLSDTRYNAIFSGNYEAWVDTLAGWYGRTAELLNQVSDAEITGHCRLQEGVYRTEFSDGTVVYVNYTEKAVTVEGTEVAPEDFIYKKGGER